MMKEWSTKSLYIVLVLLGYGIGFGMFGFIYILGFRWETDGWFILSMLPITAGTAIASGILTAVALHELWTRTREEKD